WDGGWGRRIPCQPRSGRCVRARRVYGAAERARIEMGSGGVRRLTRMRRLGGHGNDLYFGVLRGHRVLSGGELALSVESQRTVAASIGVPVARRHIFLCCDQTTPKCCEKDRGLAAWDFLKRRLKELGF